MIWAGERLGRSLKGQSRDFGENACRRPVAVAGLVTADQDNFKPRSLRQIKLLERAQYASLLNCFDLFRHDVTLVGIIEALPFARKKRW
jgi:hypothetical protein